MRNADVQTILDHITSERRKVENYIHDELTKTNTKLDALQKDLSGIREDVANTERILSDWEGKPIHLVSKQTQNKLKKNA